MELDHDGTGSGIVSGPASGAKGGKVSHPPRRVAVGALLAAATVALVLGVFALWVQRQALDTNNWTATSSQLLADPKIERAVGDYLVTELFTSVDVPGELRSVLPPQLAPLAGPAAGGLQLLAGQLVPKLLGSPAVQQAWLTANRLAHEELLRILDGGGNVVSTRAGVVTLNLYPLVDDLARQVGLQAAAATLQSKLQGGAGALLKGAAKQRLGITVPAKTGQLVIMRSSQLHTAQKIATAIRGLAAVLTIGALAMFALAVWLAHGWRRLVLRRVGWCFIAAGAGVLFARRLLEPRIVGALVSSESIRPAADAAWLIGTRLLRDLGRAMVAYGVVIVLAAWLAGATRPARALRALMAFDLRERPTFAYGTLAVAWLLLLLWGPTPALRQPIPVIGIIVISIVGLETIRHQTGRDFPNVDEDHARALLAHWLNGLRHRPIGAGNDGGRDHALSANPPAMTAVAEDPASNP